MNRRDLLKKSLTLAGGALLAAGENASALTPEKTNLVASPPGRRKLGGRLEVSSIGLGVQNMPRTYQTTIPYCTKKL